MLEKIFITPAEVLEEKLLPVGRSVLYREIKLGNIPHRKIGKKILLSRTALEKWLEQTGSDQQRAA